MAIAHTTLSDVAQFVTERGPTAAGDLADAFYPSAGSRLARRTEIERFTVGHTRPANSNIDNITPVYYASDASKTEVVLTFLFWNDDILTEMGRVGAVTELFGQVGDEWADAWRQVEAEVDHDLENTGSQEQPNGTVCPRCGDSFDYLPQHLPDCTGVE